MRRALIAMLLCGAHGVCAQAYPARPIRMLVPQPAGGAMDTVMRALGAQLSRQMGQPLVIDNRGGANGIIAGEIVAKAPPDGYPLIYTSNSLATSGGKRWHVLSDVPTLSEAGMTGFAYDPAWHAIFAPAAIPVPLSSRIHGEVTQALTTSKMRETMELGGYLPIASAPAEFRRYLEAYLKEMAVLSKETGVKPL